MNTETSRRLKQAIVVLTAAVIVLFLIISIKARFKKREKVSETPPVPVSVITVKKAPATQAVVFAGRVEPYTHLILSTERPARIVEMPVQRGSLVKKGDVLLELDSADIRAAATRAAAEWDDASRDLKRVSKLAKSGAVSTSVLDAAQKRFDFAAAGKEEAQAYLAKCTLLAPVDGRIEDKYMELGEYAGDGKPAFRIADSSRVKVRVLVPEATVVGIKKGDRIRFSVRSDHESECEAEVSFVGDAAEAGSSSFAVELVADNKDGKLKGGMIASVKFESTTHSPVVEVPFISVIPRKGEHIVYVAHNGKAVRKTVTIDSIGGVTALLSSGLDDGDRLIVEGHRSLQDGKDIEVVEKGKAE